ncbi:aromatic ring-hydroxylating dioxygenase subunit alpha [Croceicoccus ponticola]|uniref:Aromatic ring-hydroxylating dioxygenase subunit alpha n=1 Tax=Croceicoccus ponticola TaxID=2217664 RepID=A0A437GZW1_9SPHN|nr:aromatic ring-hydroxylating dioxygenase subunit alpha [Croceicoccus ponticola]RVQ68832.1 aromatic ring-hydroxylating dioxygenase subunit alpha [Croceicoccus ponticola]
MSDTVYDEVEKVIAFESARTGPRPDFPPLPEIPGGRYTSEEFFRLERESVLTRSWVCAGRDEDLRKVGDYRLWDKLGVPLLLVRGQDEKIRAFYNTCRHRGAPVVRDDAGNTRLLRCQYHSWSYGLDGKLKGVPDERDFPCLDKSDRGLIEASCDVWGGWVFVNLDKDAEPLLDYLGPLTAELDCVGMEKLRTLHVQEYSVACNWKVAMDAFLEVYHINTIHPTNAGIMLDHKAAAMGLMEGGHSRMAVRKKMNQGLNFVEFEGAPDIATMPDLYRMNNVAYMAFPNLITPVEPTGFPVLLFWPDGVGKCTMQAIYVAPDWGDGERPAFWERFLPIFDDVLEEDMMNLGPIQRSLESGGFTGMMINYQERRIYWFHEEVDRRIGAERIPEGLAVEQLLSRFAEHRLDEAAE